jgi:predicted MFS family arabinose efflux permease
MSANALFGLTFAGSQLLGFVILGPFLTRLLSLRTVFLVAVLLYLACTALILSLPPTPPARRGAGRGASRSVASDLREVWGYIRHDRLVLKGITYLTVANSGFLMLAALAPEFVQQVLRLPVDRLATIVTPAGLGMLAGVLSVGRLGRRRSRERLIDRALIAAGLLLLAFALVPTALVRLGLAGAADASLAIRVAIVLAAGLGIANAYIIVPSQTLLQERSDERIRARVLSAFFTASNTAALVPILFAGILGDLFGVVPVLAAIAVLLILIGLSAEWRGARRSAARRP